MILGGLAASLLGKSRLTADLDAVILLSVERVPELITAAGKEGFEPRLSKVTEFARTNRVLLLRHSRSGTDVDISLGVLPFEVEAVRRSQVINIGGIKIRLPSPEDLIILKAVAHRPKDILDIEAITASNPNLDWERVETWLQEFAVVLEKPEIWDDAKKFRERKLKFPVDAKIHSIASACSLMGNSVQAVNASE